MENKKKNNGIFVGILIGIIIMLLVFVGLFATGNIGFKKNTTNGQNNGNSSNESNNELTESEALNILKTKVDFAEKFFTTYANPCGEGAETDLSIQPKDGHHYYKSKQYNSFSQLNSSLLEHMSQEVINLRTQFTKENYLEQNGNLYCMDLAGGSLVNYIPEKTEYKLNNTTDNSITASIVSYIESGDDSMTEYNEKRNISVELTKNGDNWQITKYEGDRIDFFDR
ncbi:MAG: hypothetical protein VZS44_01800 [Bacilli bacterium]|nr:hypothetical protein [Bacilli bacterium]